VVHAYRLPLSQFCGQVSYPFSFLLGRFLGSSLKENGFRVAIVRVDRGRLSLIGFLNRPCLALCAECIGLFGRHSCA
jgi:hypothetical protein